MLAAIASNIPKEKIKALQKGDLSVLTQGEAEGIIRQLAPFNILQEVFKGGLGGGSTGADTTVDDVLAPPTEEPAVK